MKILILTQYFPPETGAPQNRLHSLAMYLAERGNTVNILTAMPNYPEMQIFSCYKGKFHLREKDGPLMIHRAWIFVKKSNRIVFRLINYFSFVLSSFLVGSLKLRKHDVIICESPPLFLGITALLLRILKRSKLIFNVSDLWPESAEKLGIIKNKAALKLSYSLEKLIYSKSDLVTGQTRGIVNNIKNRFNGARTYWLPNGIDYDRFRTNSNGKEFRDAMKLNSSDFVLVYAGILGHAQGLETIIKAAEIVRVQDRIKFFLVGDGPEKVKLVELAEKKGLHNLLFIPNRKHSEIPGIIAACDAFIVPLKKSDLFLGAVPSKIFEPLSMGKPILLGVDGEARDLFIEKGKCGLFFEPENSAGLAESINILFNNKPLALKLGENGRQYVRDNFDRQSIANEFYEELLKTVRY